MLLLIVLGVLPLATALFGRPIRIKLPNPVVEPSNESHDPATMRQRDAQKKLRIKSHADSMGAVKDCDTQVGDTVLVRQPKREKLSTPYRLTQLTLIRKHHSMLKAESADRQVTCNSAHFKKLVADDSITLRTSQALEGEAIDVDTESSPPSYIPASVQVSTGSPMRS